MIKIGKKSLLAKEYLPSIKTCPAFRQERLGVCYDE